MTGPGNRGFPGPSTGGLPGSKPDPREFNRLGTAALRAGRTQEAMQQFQRALAIDPRHIPTLTNLATLHWMIGDADKAIVQFETIIRSQPNPPAFENLSLIHLTRGDVARAAPVLVQGIRAAETPKLRELFVSCAAKMRAVKDDPGLRELTSRALAEGWGPPLELVGLGASLIKVRPEIAACMARAEQAWPRRLTAAELFGVSGLAQIASEPLLLNLLEATHIADVGLERFLTAVRSALLQWAADSEASPVDPRVLRFQVALARHCFINEYIFAVTADEQAAASALRDRVASALLSGAPPPAQAVAAVASYFPLSEMPQASALLDAPALTSIAPLLLQQVREPLEEAASRAALPRLTPIDDGVSQQVREQYEENPYPRWIKAPPVPAFASLDDFLGMRFRQAGAKPPGRGAAFDILVAGCGTGPKVAELSQLFPAARMLAIDLSLASLSYSQRKSREAGFKNVSHGQADILRVGELKRSFDLIDACGVLHHMNDAFAGWRALLSVLRPRGVMLVALYSVLAREHLGPASRLIAERGYRPVPDDIRRFRQELIDEPDRASHEGVLASQDFYTTSTCRDLLFHVHENRLTLPQIDGFLKANRLSMLGFELPAPIMQRYAARFPEDTAGTNLDLWDRFEHEHPETFSGMYYFWVQRGD